MYFLTYKIEPVGWGKAGRFVGDKVSVPRRHPAEPSLAVITSYQNYGAIESVISPWEGTEEELLKLAENPRELILWALDHMDCEHTDFIDGILGANTQEVYVNGREVDVSDIKW